MKKRILLFHLFICINAINSIAASKSIDKEHNQTQQEYKSSQLTGTITATVTAADVKCFGGNDGTATVIVSGGTATYTYLWNDAASQTTATATGLKAGTYKVIVTDALGYTTSAPVIIAEPLPLRTTTSSIAVKCFGANDGTATIIASGGIAPYTYFVE